MCTIKDDLEATGAKCSGSGDKECKKCEYTVQTNADRMRSMTDEELAEIMNDVVGFETGSLVPFCQNKKECDKELDKGNLIPDAWCERCLLEWLRSESEE